MLSKTLQDGLNDYGIGAKVRALRLQKKIGLVDLGKHTGLSPALPSRIERGRLFPTLPTLLRIALGRWRPRSYGPTIMRASGCLLWTWTRRASQV